MSAFRWSRLYPSAWREEFEQEFDAVVEARGLGTRDALDMAVNAAAAWLEETGRVAPTVAAWATIAALNLVAREVQWTAGALLVACAATAARHAEGWPGRTLLLALAVPASTLLLYEMMGGPHAALFHTAVALLPALAGSLLGLGISRGLAWGERERAA